jgi:hypothetical protein
MMMRLLIIAVLATGALLGPVFAAKVTPDLLPAPRRQPSVDTALRLASRTSLPDLPADMASPFNPAGFDQAEADPIANAAQRPAAGPNAVPAPLTTREILETLALRLNPSGTIVANNKSLLLLDRNRFEVGTKFVVTYEGREYELQLVSIDRTTFTLRYRGEETTRPIKPLK